MTKSRTIQRLISAIILMCALWHCARPTFAQITECGFDLIEQHRVNYDELAYRSDTILTVPVVVHIIHIGEPIGTGSNISDAQINSAIGNFNERMATNPHGDVGLRLCLAEVDPDGNETTGITRHQWSILYSTMGLFGQTIGETPQAMAMEFGWPRDKYYNIYSVTEIDDNGGGWGIQGYAYFPTPSIVDGAYLLHNVIGFDPTGAEGYNLKPTHNFNTTFVHEIGHAMNLYHTFESTASCTSETNCSTQGDRVCDTPPHPVTQQCSQNCSSAPTSNHMGYSPQTCRNEVTVGQIARMQTALLLSPWRFPLLESNVCTYDDFEEPPDDEICNAPCANDWCENAIEIGCEPVDLCNTNCSPNFECILQHPVVSSVCCGGTTQWNTQWFKFETFSDVIMDMELGGNFSTGILNDFGNYGALEGVTWSLATGDCDNLEWIASYQCHSYATNCFCGPPGPDVWAGPCDEAPCDNPVQLTDYWHEVGLYPQGNWIPYDPTQQVWNMSFPLSAGTYYLMIGGYAAFGPTPSVGEATLSVCLTQPLNTKPELKYRNSRLEWTGETQTDWAVFTLVDMQWTEIARTTKYILDINESGYYIVAGSSGFSNAVNVEFPRSENVRGYNVLGQESNKMTIK